MRLSWAAAAGGLRLSMRTGWPAPQRRLSSTLADYKVKFNKVLKREGYGQPTRIDAKTKTVSTIVGDLPISPIMDTKFVEARQKFRRPKPKAQKSEITHKIRKKLLRNPYAHALATPIRECPLTETFLPKYFLLKLKAVPHPTTKNPWVTLDDTETVDTLPSSEPANKESPTKPKTTSHATDADPSAAATATTNTSQKPPPGMPAHPTAYILPRKRLLHNIALSKGAAPHSQEQFRLFRKRDRFLRFSPGRLVWRQDMDEFVLDQMRRKIVASLTYFLQLHEQDGRDYLRPCPTWESVKDMTHRGCLLWIPSKLATQSGPRESEASVPVAQFATYNVPDAKWEMRLPVHDLERLLGQTHMATLRQQPLFRDNTLIMLGKQRTMPLQLRLWTLEGYLAEYPGEEDINARVFNRRSTRKERNALAAKEGNEQREDASLSST